MALIRIKNIEVNTIIGVNDWERTTRQKLIINVSFDYDDSQAVSDDQIDHAVDYRALTKKIVSHVEQSSFFLLEKLTASIVDLIMTDSRIAAATVEVDKPGSVRYAESVSVEHSAIRA